MNFKNALLALHLADDKHSQQALHKLYNLLEPTSETACKENPLSSSYTQLSGNYYSD